LKVVSISPTGADVDDESGAEAVIHVRGPDPDLERGRHERKREGREQKTKRRSTAVEV
jgi:hypothetical protein